jgi:hypothetical protein
LRPIVGATVCAAIEQAQVAFTTWQPLKNSAAHRPTSIRMKSMSNADEELGALLHQESKTIVPVNSPLQ